MLQKEKIVRECLQLWSTLEGTIKSYREMHHPDFIWWNSARGKLGGLQDCIKGVEVMHGMLGVGRVEVVVRNVMAQPGRVTVERSDDLYRADGSVIAKVPVVGVFEFKGDKIIELRDYCDDWMRDFRPDDAPRSLL